MSKRLAALASSMSANYENDRQFRNEYAYQYGHTGREAIFTDGADYFAIQKAKPKYDTGAPWVPHGDQFFASRIGLTVWFSSPDGVQP